ncbi:Nif3-like dinuclear metal center hexameric protein [Devriesea agamarum]|uniref:Nif3-like dinuclear metal center hexameric protein n=1 Tax=Devriesea agamarum TaxID=472569 RepID=UPI00071CD2D3|nr:Nif3-like dinuclear metal center hexameric protein [Devriesea agamarum]
MNGPGELTVADVIEFLEGTHPLAWAEDWDQVGLAVGDPHAQVQRVLLAVDPTIAVAEQAASVPGTLLITHHPLLLRGIHAVTPLTGKGAVITRLLSAQCALWCGHTNVDRSAQGTNAALGDLLDLHNTSPLQPPRSEDTGLVGLGLVGDLRVAQSVQSLAARLAEALPRTVQGAKYTGDPHRIARRVALCSGAGDSLLETATHTGCDVYITSDLRHHPALEHLESCGGGKVPALIDVPHFASEWMWLPGAKASLAAFMAERGLSCPVEVSELLTDPWTGAELG